MLFAAQKASCEAFMFANEFSCKWYMMRPLATARPTKAPTTISAALVEWYLGTVVRSAVSSGESDWSATTLTRLIRLVSEIETQRAKTWSFPVTLTGEVMVQRAMLDLGSRMVS